MINTDNIKAFNDVLYYLTKDVKMLLSELPESIKAKTTEIRLRADKPIVLTGLYGICFPCSGGRYSFLSPDKTPIVSYSDIENTVISLCNKSVYSHQEEINRGYISFGRGYRAGVAGTAVRDSKDIMNIRAFSSVNIRIAKDIAGCADDIVDRVFKDGLVSTVIFGAPMCGKTTVLKDIARILSSSPYFYRTAVADERCEMHFTQGVNIDYFCGYPKKTAIEYAVRAFSPEVIICDELGNLNECKSVLAAVDCGVKFVLSVHSASIEEFCRRDMSKALIRSGSFERFIFLKGIGEYSEIFTVEELYAQVNSSGNDNSFFSDYGSIYEFASDKADIGA